VRPPFRYVYKKRRELFMGSFWISILVNILVKSLALLGIPLVWWYITARKDSRFPQWVGITEVIKTNQRKFVISVILAIVYVLLMPTFYAIVHPDAFQSNESPGFSGIMFIYPLIIHPVFETGFLEEVGFRGFVGKRLIRKFGFGAGNTLQAVIFGLAHNLIAAYRSSGLIAAVGVFLITGVFGWIAGYVTEKQAGGSIIPVWILHACANTGLFHFKLI